MSGGGWIVDLACATLDGALKTTVLVAASAAWLRFARPSDPGVRSRVWALTLLAAVSIPAVAAVVPARGPGWLPAPITADIRTHPVPAVPASPRSDVADRAATLGPGRATGTTSPISIEWPPVWVTLWSAVAIGLLARRAIGIVRLRRAARRPALDPGETARRVLQVAASRVGVERVPDLVVSDLVAGPATCGFLRPTILLPRVAVSWSAERLDLVLRHELVHVRRGDWLLRQVLHVACAVYWFQPLVWLVARRVAEEQEFACDREVVDSGARPRLYARHLIEVARAAVRPAATPVPALDMARRSRMEDRLMAVLEDRRTDRPARRVLPALLLTLVLVPALGAVRTWSGATDGVAPSVEVGESEVADGSNRARIAQLASEIDAATAEMEGAVQEIERFVAAEIEPVTAQIERHVEAELEPLQAEMDAIAERMEPIAREIAKIHEEERATALAVAEQRLAEAEASERADRLDEVGRARHEAAMREYERALRMRDDELRALEEALRSHQEELEVMHESVRPTERELAELAERLRPEEARLREIEESLRPHERRLRAIAEELQQRVSAEIRAIVEREALAEGVRSPAAIEAASVALARKADLDTDGGVVTLSISRARVRVVVADHFEGRLSEAAADRIAAALSDFRAP
jgi:beta-lactamase regulating signal transducer with metallopeptidase domain